MKHEKSLGIIAAAILLSLGAPSAGAADQNPTDGNYPGNRGYPEQGMQRDEMQPQGTQNRDRRASRSSRSEAGLVECKDSPKCRQRNPNWVDLQGEIKPPLVDPATGMPPKK